MWIRSMVVALAAFAAGCSPDARPAPSAGPTAADTGWVARSALYEVFVRDFSPTGDFAGVTAGLDRIEAAGADVVWLMPVFPVGVLHRKGPLGSPYSVSDYVAVNPEFGTLDDFRALVRAAHGRGMKVILDWVPNHTSWDHVWVREHPDYHVRDSTGSLTVPRDERGNLTDWTDVAQLDYANPAMRRAMIDALRFWLQELEVDGFRMDVAGFVPDAFWREALPALRSAVDRPILLLAEWGDVRMHRLGFDLTYAWDTYSRLKTVWRGAPASTWTRDEEVELRSIPPGGLRLRFTTNHDETAWDQPPVALFGGPAGARAAFVAMALLPGRPLLYAGQEVESPQQLGLFTREAIVWDQPGAEAARAFYRRVVTLARTEPAFLWGGYLPAGSSAPDDVIAYRRGDAVVLVNARAREIRIQLPELGFEGARDLLTGSTHRGDTVSLAPYGAVVLQPVTGRFNGGSPR